VFNLKPFSCHIQRTILTDPFHMSGWSSSQPETLYASTSAQAEAEESSHWIGEWTSPVGSSRQGISSPGGDFQSL